MGILYAQEGRWAAALPWAERLVELDRDSVARNLLDRIRSALGAWLVNARVWHEGRAAGRGQDVVEADTHRGGSDGARYKAEFIRSLDFFEKIQ